VADGDRPWDAFLPARPAALIFASPHSGRLYPPEFLAQSRLDPLTLRRSEDAFMDELFGGAPALGAPLIRARFPRSFVDPNREAYELDPAMFEDRLPPYANTTSPRVAAGLGTIPRVVSTGDEIYRGKLRFADAERRIASFYVPYHEALGKLVEDTLARTGACLLVDCHSMPSVGGPMDKDPGLKRVDVVLGDCHGSSCAPVVTETAERALKALGYTVTRNNPYAGGFTTRHYGRPRRGVHALQIEINRTLYMDERSVARKDGFAELARRLGHVIESLAAIDRSALAAC
jgi:N-formylglutamate amidohydrolase